MAPAGSVIMFNSADPWHFGTFSYSPAPRLAVTAGFRRGHSPIGLTAADLFAGGKVSRADSRVR